MPSSCIGTIWSCSGNQKSQRRCPGPGATTLAAPTLGRLKSFKMGKFLSGLFWIAALVGVLVGASRLVAIRWWQIPSDDPVLEASIAPTLHGGDWVILWRATPPRFGALTVCPDPE